MTPRLHRFDRIDRAARLMGDLHERDPRRQEVIQAEAAALARDMDEAKLHTWEVLLQSERWPMPNGGSIPLTNFSHDSLARLLKAIRSRSREAFIFAGCHAGGGGYDDERYGRYLNWCSPHEGEAPTKWIERTPLVTWLREHAWEDGEPW